MGMVAAASGGNLGGAKPEFALLVGARVCASVYVCACVHVCVVYVCVCACVWNYAKSSAGCIHIQPPTNTRHTHKHTNILIPTHTLSGDNFYSSGIQGDENAQRFQDTFETRKAGPKTAQDGPIKIT